MKPSHSLPKTMRRRKRSTRTNQRTAVHIKQARVILLNKPYNTLCQFTGEAGVSLLKDYVPIRDVYPAGRLDKDSEGLVVLTNHGAIQAAITEPKHQVEKTYWALVEGVPLEADLKRFSQGIQLKDGTTQPARVRVIDKPEGLWPRTPPVRIRQSIKDTWLAITLTEGKNRQVRRMTAAIGYPTLRLIRSQVGPFSLNNLQPGEYIEIKSQETIESLLPDHKK